MLDRTPRRPIADSARASLPKAASRKARRHRSAPAVLAIGDRGASSRGVIDAATGAQVVVATFDDLDAALLERHRPSVVISHVMARGFDALDLARRLVALGFRGRFVALAEALPCPALVRAEVACACPSLEVGVVVVGTNERPTVRVV